MAGDHQRIPDASRSRAVESIMRGIDQANEPARHIEMLSALEAASARSWRRDIAIAAIGAAFGVVGTLIVTVVTG